MTAGPSAAAPSGRAPAVRVRSLGVGACVALVVGNMVGSGVFLLPASLAPYGWNAVAGWIVTIAGAMGLAVTFALLGRAFPRAGGPYVFTREAFGRFPAFLVAWSYWISLWAGNAGLAIGAVSYLSALVPGATAIPGLPALATCALVWLLTAINCLGVRQASRVQTVTTLIKMLPLIAVLAVAGLILWRHGTPALLPFHAADLSLPAIGASATLTLWAMLGVESVTVPADNVRDPARTIPRATLIGTASAGLIHLFVCSAVGLLAVPAMMARSAAPLADFVAGTIGSWAAPIIIGFAALSALGALNGWVLLQGEMPFAMARDGVFPAWLGRLSRRDTPVNAHLASSGLMTLILLLNFSRSMSQLFTFIALLTTASSLFAYLACALAALRLASAGRIAMGLALRVVVALAAVYSVWTIWGAGFEAGGWGLVLVAMGVPVHWLMRHRQAREALA